MPLDLIERIRSFPLFQSTPDSFLVDIGLLLKPQLHSSNDYIITEGEDAKAMYWLVRGAVAVTSRDGESTYAELKPGAFFGEIGILMERPRTATVVARTRCLVLVLKKEDLTKILPKYPEVERAIRDEALERLTQLEKKKRQVLLGTEDLPTNERRGSKRRAAFGEDVLMDDGDHGAAGASKRRKSPSPGTNEVSSASALGHGLVNIRATLKEFPLFASLPADILHFLGLNAQPRSFPPFTDIIKQGTRGREIYFIVRGEVEVLDEKNPTTPKAGQPPVPQDSIPPTPRVKARLRAGQYFGEVVSLSLADRRTATVRSVTQVECLMISENVLSDFWSRCPAEILQQIEKTAKERLGTSSEMDIVMNDTDNEPSIHQLAIGESKSKAQKKINQAPRVTFTEAELGTPLQSGPTDESVPVEPIDPDPYLDEGLEKVKSRSRRGSLAPPPPDETAAEQRRRSPRTSPATTASASPRSSMSTASSPTLEHKGALVNTCGRNVETWRMKSVWDVTAPAILEMANKAPGLKEVDFSNCRKVSDTLLARIVGWVIPAQPLVPPNRAKLISRPVINTKTGTPMAPPAPGTVIGCPELKAMTLSYCKHVTDRTMAHIATHAHSRIESIDLTRCTTITDAGFQFWGNVKFERLRKLCLADCTYLSDQSIVWLVNGAGSSLRQLDLSFCCALSDTATEVLALGCPNLTHVNLSFCGSAVSDPSLRSIGLHLTSLKELAVRGCVRVTGLGVQSVVEGCPKLQLLDVSQCKNLQPWLVAGGVERWRSAGRDIEFVTVSTGTKLVR
ncbi:RNI-like protein, partial [Aureobasidium melanogenum]